LHGARREGFLDHVIAEQRLAAGARGGPLDKSAYRGAYLWLVGLRAGPGGGGNDTRVPFAMSSPQPLATATGRCARGRGVA
jgi:hypothetical protein